MLGRGGWCVGGEGRREYSLLVCHGNRETAPESRAHTAAEEVFRQKCKGKCFDRQSGETQEPFPEKVAGMDERDFLEGVIREGPQVLWRI